MIEWIIKIILIIMVFIMVSGCKIKYDSFDPATSTLKWIIERTHENERYN